MKKFRRPFLWNFIEVIEHNPANTEAQERITKSANEENYSYIVKLDI